LDFVLTAGQIHDCTQAEALLHPYRFGWVLADKGYDTDRVLAFIRERDGIPVIPPKVTRAHPGPFDKERYKLRHLIENLIAKLKQFRSLATRYDKTSRNFTAMVALACILTRLRI
jgi:transposase